MFCEVNVFGHVYENYQLQLFWYLIMILVFAWLYFK